MRVKVGNVLVTGGLLLARFCRLLLGRCCDAVINTSRPFGLSLPLDVTLVTSPVPNGLVSALYR